MNYIYRCFGIIFMIASLMVLIFYNEQLKCCSILPSNSSLVMSIRNPQLDKWIVITTINYPTDAVKALANQIGWRVVVVADKNTPSDWNLIGCDFLSIEKQKKLNFAVSTLIPYHSYTRKMIGYLYAIKNGAQWIYDTDDDNQPIEAGINIFDMQSFVTGLSYGKECYDDCNITRPLFNAYAFWGQPKIWPRGYPLEEVQKLTNETKFTICKEQKLPAIQQALVTKDLDDDALFGLLNAKKTTKFDKYFSKHAPPIILNAGTFSPFNSRNTLFHYDAFWSLVLPVSVSLQVTDIWRGYFAQKLLHLTGNRLGFYPVNAVQKRNSQSYFSDVKDETELFVEAGKMVEFISQWTCEHNSLQDCMRKLSQDFVVNKFWNELDVTLVKAWITDLDSVGFIFPPLLKFHNKKNNETSSKLSKDCRSAALHFPVHSNSKQDRIRKTYDDLKDWCNEALPVNETFNSCYRDKNSLESGVWQNLSRIALIVTGNYPFGPSISILQRLYNNYFATVIFCGTVEPSNIAKYDGYLPLPEYNYINVTKEEINKGYRAYMCTAKAIELRLRNIDGYLTIADDTQFNFWNDFDYSRFRLWGIDRKSKAYWWNEPHVGRNAIKRAIELIRNRIQLNPGSSFAKLFAEYSKAVGGDGFSFISAENMWSTSDFYYLPKENETVFYELSEVFFESNVFHEIVVPKIGAGLQWLQFYNGSKPDIANWLQLWNANRPKWEKFYTKYLIYLHPIKLSYVQDLEIRRKYCHFIIRSYFSSIFNESSMRAKNMSIITIMTTTRKMITTTTTATTETPATKIITTTITSTPALINRTTSTAIPSSNTTTTKLMDTISKSVPSTKKSTAVGKAAVT